MKGCMLILSIISLFLMVQTDPQTQTELQRKVIDYPEVPRVSAFEAYAKYKAGKAIIVYGGGEAYNRRHIVGAYNLDSKDRKKLLLKFPKQGIEIFTYCY